MSVKRQAKGRKKPRSTSRAKASAPTQPTSAKTRDTAPGKRRTLVKRDNRPWGAWIAMVIVGVACLRLLINAAELVPVHFDEAQYWAYGHELAAGHFSKPPLTGWLILAATEMGGDTLFWLRLWAVLAHSVVAGLIYLTGRALLTSKIGFWAAAGYTAAPGVSASGMIMSTDPVMMMFWALALYAWVQSALHPRVWMWWCIAGAALGAAILAKYTALAFLGGALGYALFSARRWTWAGAGVLLAACALVVWPNVAWQLGHDFVTVSHVAEDAQPGGQHYNLGKMAEFVGSQFGVIGPIWLIGILGSLWTMKTWRGNWRLRLLAWQTVPLLVVITLVAFYSRAHPNWAAPAYIAGSLMAAHFFVERRSMAIAQLQLIIGAVAAMALYAAAALYSAFATDLPRAADPFKKMRLSEPYCGPLLGAMAEEGAEGILSTDRRRLSECMFLGGFGFEGIAVWNPDGLPDNHHELVSSLQPGDTRRLILAAYGPSDAAVITARFEEAYEVDTGTFRTHLDREGGYSFWVVQGFRGY